DRAGRGFRDMANIGDQPVGNINRRMRVLANNLRRRHAWNGLAVGVDTMAKCPLSLQGEGWGESVLQYFKSRQRVAHRAGEDQNISRLRAGTFYRFTFGNQSERGDRDRERSFYERRIAARAKNSKFFLIFQQRAAEFFDPCLARLAR